MARGRALRCLLPAIALASGGCFDFDGLLGRHAPPYSAVSDPVVPDDASAGTGDGGPPDLATDDSAVDPPPRDLLPLDLVAASDGTGLDLTGDGGAPADMSPSDGGPDGSLDAGRDLAAPPDLRVAPQIQHLATLIAPSDVRVGDLTGDGKPDILVAFPGGSSVVALINRGNGAFAWSAPTLLLATPVEALAPLTDFDGDGRLDFAGTSSAAGKVLVGFGRGDGTFDQLRALAVESQPAAVDVAEMNGDKHRDLVVGCRGSGNVMVLTGAAKGQFAAGGKVTVGKKILLAVGDLDGDGAIDLAGDDGPGVGNATFYAVKGRGDGTFSGNLQSWNGVRASGLVLADLDADGALDIVYGDSKVGVVGVLRNRGNLAFDAPVTSASGGPAPSALAVGDLDVDGAPDVVCADSNDNHVAVLRGSNRLQLGAPILFRTGAGPVAVRLADLDGDGRPDIVTADPAGPSVSVILGPL